MVLSDFADQPMRLVGPRRERGIAEQPVKFQSRYVVAFAGAGPQSLLIEDGDVAAPISDEPCFLQASHDIGDGCSPHAEHHSEKFMGQQEIA